ncbi:MAG: Swarming motility protein SwrC [Phycisphaerae bacterium]|nr:Swarming motility protein SwrC [Phycisphaerae bacterium]
MKLSEFSVHRPVFTIMVLLIVLILGGISLMRLPIDLMPDITYPTLSVSTTYENAGPEEIEELISRPIEEAMSAVPGVQEVTSTSTEGQSNVRVSFAWGTDLDAAANDVRDRLDRVVGNLPDDADKPTLRKFDLASFPVLILGVYGDLDPVQMRRTIDDQISYRFERVPGVAALDVRGGLDREIHVNLNVDKIKALNIPLDTILDRIEAENVNVPAGTIDRGNYEVLIRTPGEYANLDELRNTVIALRDGVPVQLRDVGEVEDSWQRVREIVRVNGKPGLRLSINKQSGTNTVEVAKAALAELDRINADFPQIHIVPIIDTSKYIERSIRNVGSSATYGGLLAVLVLLFFLRNVRSTMIIAMAIPASIVATFALMYFGGFTLNIMTLGGLALGVGMLVDNAIVVLENIYRLHEAGQPPEQAAINGSSEVTAAIIASTLTTLAVFLPLLFVRGMAGVMFRQLSLVVSFSLLCSLAVALTVVPMLAAKMLRAQVRSAARGAGRETLLHRLFRVTGRMFTAMEDGYRDTLRFALHHRAAVVIGAALLLIGSVALFPLIGSELMPSTDEGEVRVGIEMDVGTRPEVVSAKMAEIEKIVKASVPETDSTVAFMGGASFRSRGPHTGELRVALTPESRRSRSSEQIAAELRKKLSRIAGATIRTRAGQGLFLLRLGTSDDKVQVEIRGHELEVADALAERVQEVVQGISGVTDVQLSRESGSPEELIIVNRHKAAEMKLSVKQIAEMLQTVLSGTRASNYRDGGDEFRILVQMKNAERMSLDDVLNLTLTNSDNQAVVLRNVVDIMPRGGPVRVERKNQERVVTVSANISGRDLGSILQDIRKGLSSVVVPRDFGIVFGGDYEDQVKAFRELMLSFVLALVLVYMVMACQYESLRDPFVVMFSVPLAAIGVMVLLFLTNTTFNVQSFIGCIMLGGIVVNNAILLVDHTNLLRRRDGMELFAAIEEAGRRRLRPILMTALTTVLGLLPLAMGMGEGGEAQAPMARAVVGGLVSSTLITLVFVPVMYSIFEWRMSRHSPALDPRSAAPSSG